MFFHNEEIYNGDRVFDISMNRGYGNVIRVLDKKFEVRFARISVFYDSQGVQQGKSRPTLFWDQPLVINPTKDEYNWAIKRDLIAEFLKLVDKSKEIL